MAFVTVETDEGIKSIHTDKVVEMDSYATETGAQFKITYDNGTRAIYKDFSTLEEAKDYHRSQLLAPSPSNFMIAMALDRPAGDLDDDGDEAAADPKKEGEDSEEEAPKADPEVPTEDEVKTPPPAELQGAAA